MMTNNEQWLFTIELPQVPRGLLDRFKYALEELERKLRLPHGLTSISTALKWLFDKSEAMRLLNTIERQMSLFSLVLQNDYL
jgi:hypothetical protein